VICVTIAIATVLPRAGATNRAAALPARAVRGFARQVWETLVFLVNALLFVLMGLRLPLILDGLSGQSAAELIG
jgi:NhaP-type Na+/H+ or K+/H+ antiporter